MVRVCNADIFVVVHNKDNDKLFSITSESQFNL